MWENYVQSNATGFRKVSKTDRTNQLDTISVKTAMSKIMTNRSVNIVISILGKHTNNNKLKTMSAYGTWDCSRNFSHVSNFVLNPTVSNSFANALVSYETL